MKEAAVSLIPKDFDNSPPNYYCTWQLMEWVPGNTENANLTIRDVLTDERLFGENGLAKTMYPKIRNQLIFLVDDGWEVADSANGTLKEEVWFKPYLGSGQLHPSKFPGYGNTPAERLKTLADKIKAEGWKGAGIWISPKVAYAGDVIGREKGFLEYFKIRLEWSKYAGIAYWKIDWGDYDFSDKYRKKLGKLKDEIYPELILENSQVRSPFNAKGQERGIYLAFHRYRLAYSDVLRTYDVTYQLATPTTLSRVAALLTHLRKIHDNVPGYINAEDELYLCSGLGLAMGIMRFPVPNGFADNAPPFTGGLFPSPKPVSRKLDEVERAIRWQRIAPAYSCKYGFTKISEKVLTDNWRYAQNEDIITQGAPQTVARGIELPKVTPAPGCLEPYVVASKNPSGAVSIAALGRVTAEKGSQKASADVTLNIGKNTGKIGVFGYYNSLTIETESNIENKRIFACDLLDDNAYDITEDIKLSAHKITIDGALIDKIGLMKASENDVSEPGLIIQIGDAAGFEKTELEESVPKTSEWFYTYTFLKGAAAKFHIANKRRIHKSKIREFDRSQR